MDFLIILAFVALMIGFNALYVAGEFATVSARKNRIQQQAEEGNRLARTLLPVLEDSHKLDNYIAASQVGITLSSIALGIYGQNALTPMLQGLFASLPLQGNPWLERALTGGATATLVLVILTILQVVLGELVPKTLAIRYPERVALATAIPMRWSADFVLKPLIVLLNGSGQLVLRLLGFEYGGGHAHIHSPEEIEILVSESHKGGLLDAEERQLLHNAFRIGELSAGEIMVPRTRIVAVHADAPVEEALALAVESAYTRIPLYQDNLDQVIGFVHLKDLFRLHQSGSTAALRTILRKAPFVPETAPAVEVWNMLNAGQSYIAIVFDEYGGTAGMITQEDLIEELFGELQDEFDDESALIEPDGKGRIVVRGDMLVSYLNERLLLSLPTDVANTVGGLILDQLGRSPIVGDEVEVSTIRFKVEAVAGRSVAHAQPESARPGRRGI